MLESQGLRASVVSNVRLEYTSIGISGTTNSATKTISINIGTGTDFRWVIAWIAWPASTTGRTISSATIAGVSASIAVNIASTSTTFGFGCFFARVSSGGTQTITVNLTGTTNSSNSGFAVYNLTGRNSLAFSASNDSGAATTTSRTTTLTVPSNGFSLNFWAAVLPPTSATWSGSPSTPVDQSPTNNVVCSSGFENFFSSSRSVSATFSHSNSIASRMISSSFTFT
jgi:hypothetical protein